MGKKINISLPKGKEAKNVQFKVEDGKIEVIYDLEDKFEPKDGDFLATKSGRVFIYNGRNTVVQYGAYCGIDIYNKIILLNYFSCGWTGKEGCRYATPEEKSAFLERLEKELGKTWNAKNKCLEDIYVPKFGDIVKVVSPRKAERNYMICIFPDKEIPKEQTNNFYDIANVTRALYLSNGCGFVLDQTIAPASESEKQELFDKLAEVGKRWNPDTKKLEDIVLEPKYGEYYFYVNTCGGVSKSIYSTAHDRCMIEIGNAFETEEAAKPYADQIKEIFKNSKAE